MITCDGNVHCTRSTGQLKATLVILPKTFPHHSQLFYYSCNFVTKFIITNKSCFQDDFFFKPFVFSTFPFLVCLTHKTHKSSLQLPTVLLLSLWIFLSKKTVQTISMHYEPMNTDKNWKVFFQKGLNRKGYT